jgi:sensor histidine kinase YesM
MCFYYNFEFLSAFIDAFVLWFLFAIIGLSVWYTMRSAKPTKTNFITLFSQHFGTATLSLTLWLLAGNSLSEMFISSDLNYVHFIEKTIPLRLAMGFSAYMVLILTYYLIIYIRDLREKTEREIRLESEVREAELNLLKSQINPHFLFNSLNSVCSLTVYNPTRAHDMIIKLSEFLRYSLANGNNRFTRLSDEIQNIKRYLEIEKTRFGDRLLFNFEVNENCENFLLPGMILQPLFENAVKHGVYESTEPVTLYFTAKITNNLMEISLANNFDPEAPPRKGTGTGIRNIRERLRLIYNDENLLRILREPTRFTATLLIPNFVPDLNF